MEELIKDIKQRTKRWWKQNLANIISSIGLIASFWFLLAILLEPGNTLKIIFFASIAGITDFIDGPVARMLKTESIFGSYLDRIRDRIFVYPTIVILAWHQRDKIIFPELLYCLMASLAVFEVLLFRIGAIGLWWHIKGINVNLLPNNWGKRKIFAGFVVVFIWLISLAIESLNIPCLKYSIWIIYLGLVLMVYWSHVSWKEYMERSKEARNKKAQNNL